MTAIKPAPGRSSTRPRVPLLRLVGVLLQARETAVRIRAHAENARKVVGEHPGSSSSSRSSADRDARRGSTRFAATPRRPGRHQDHRALMGVGKLSKSLFCAGLGMDCQPACRQTGAGPPASPDSVATPVRSRVNGPRACGIRSRLSHPPLMKSRAARDFKVNARKTRRNQCSRGTRRRLRSSCSFRCGGS